MVTHPCAFDAPTQPVLLSDCQPDDQPRPRPGHGGKAWSKAVVSTLGWRQAPTADALLGAARQAFTACLIDLPAPDTGALCQLLRHAHSLEELWHLRPELYRQLALHRSQAEAEHQLSRLNRFFKGVGRPHRVAPPTPTRSA